MIDLTGKKVLITGGTRGIGRAAALLFGAAGCDCAVNYVKNSELARTLHEELKGLGRQCLSFKADVANREDVRNMVDSISSTWGRIDILINNAGVWTYGAMGNMPESVWCETMKINLDGVYYVCNEVVPLMKSQKDGNIINVSSTAGVRGEAFHSHYAATKGALIALTKSLAVELAPSGIRVNCVAPGWVDTDMCTEIFKDEDYRRRVEESIPLRRIPPPEDIAAPILFLASDLARHITGETINVNGGSVLCS